MSYPPVSTLASEERPWRAALGEHHRAVRELIATCERISVSRWHQAPAPGKWTPSDVVLHLCRAYELGRDAAHGGPGMRLLVLPSRARVLRTLLLPAILLTDRFPRGVRAPAEVVPDASERSMPDAALDRLRRAAQEAAAALRRVDEGRPVRRVTHAYFGPLTPRTALRVLTAHTRHHTRALARFAVPTGED